MNLKIKKIVTVNYIIFGLSIILAWFYYIPTPRYINTSAHQIDDIRAYLQRKLDVVMEMRISNSPKDLKLLDSNSSVLKSSLEKKSMAVIPSQGAVLNENANVILNIDCLTGANQNSLEVQSLSSFKFSGDCNELQSSAPLQRQVARVISTLTSDLIDEVQLNLAFEVIHLNVYLIISAESKVSSVDSLKQDIIDVAGIFCKKMGLPQSQYRLNFQTLYIEDLPLITKPGQDNSKILTVKDVENFVDNYPAISQEQIYSFETEDINWYIFADKDTYFEDVEEGRYTHFDEKNEKYAVMTVPSQSSEFKVLVLRTLYRAFELTTIQDSLSNLKNLDLRYDNSIEFSLFNQRRRKFLLKKIIHGLETFKYVLTDSELVIEKDVGEKIDAQINHISQVSTENLSLQELKAIYRTVFTLNYDGNSKFGHRDSFSDDYRIGVYIPLLLPFFFPIIKAVKALRKTKIAQ